MRKNQCMIRIQQPKNTQQIIFCLHRYPKSRIFEIYRSANYRNSAFSNISCVQNLVTLQKLWVSQKTDFVFKICIKSWCRINVFKLTFFFQKNSFLWLLLILIYDISKTAEPISLFENTLNLILNTKLDFRYLLYFFTICEKLFLGPGHYEIGDTEKF